MRVFAPTRRHVLQLAAGGGMLALGLTRVAARETRVARLNGKDLWFVANYRHYSEVSPSAVIRSAQLDRFEYVALGLEFENGLGVTYSTGKLPLDRAADRVFDIGYRLKL